MGPLITCLSRQGGAMSYLLITRSTGLMCENRLQKTQSTGVSVLAVDNNDLSGDRLYQRSVESSTLL